MANTIILKNSSTAAAVPVAGDLTAGELAVNTADRKLYTKNVGGTVVQVGDIATSLDGGLGGSLPYQSAAGVTAMLANGTAGQLLQSNGTTVAPSWVASLNPLTSGTAVASTSGTAIDFTGIPSWVKKITVMFRGVSTNGSSHYLVQIGAGSPTTSGYTGSASVVTTGVATTNLTTGFGVYSNLGAATVISGGLTITTLGSNVWVASGVSAIDTAIGTMPTAGAVTLSGTLDRVRITTVNGTDTFDAGSINIMYE